MLSSLVVQNIQIIFKRLAGLHFNQKLGYVVLKIGLYCIENFDHGLLEF